MTEQWRQVPSFGGYIVSDKGRIRHRRVNAPILKGSLDKDGYRRVRLHGVSLRVHRVVCETFHGPCPEGLECAHLNSEKLDNRAENLAWVTRSENQQHNVARGVARYSAPPGESHHGAKVTLDQVEQIRAAVASGQPQRKVARVFGISQTQVCHIAAGKRWAESNRPDNRPQSPDNSKG